MVQVVKHGCLLSRFGLYQRQYEMHALPQGHDTLNHHVLDGVALTVTRSPYLRHLILGCYQCIHDLEVHLAIFDALVDTAEPGLQMYWGQERSVIPVFHKSQFSEAGSSTRRN